MARLIVVSNRGPFRRQKGAWVRSSGGLVTALDPVLRERGGVWVAAREGSEGSERSLPDDGYELGSVDLPQSVQRRFYADFSNAALWPLLHSFPPTIRLATAPWPDYEQANRGFADAALEAAGRNDLVWVQDYHLMLVPGLLRERRPGLRIGWFCHVPWPAPDLFRILPWSGKLLDALLAADVLGFHTEQYAHNFLECAERLAKKRVDHRRRVVRSDHGETRVRVAPIGIPWDDVQSLMEKPPVRRTADRVKKRVGERRVILGVDRLDYTKGIPERLLAYDQLLARSPEARDEWVMVQVMVPSRTDVRAYAALKTEIDQLVGSINGRYGKTGQVPVHYLFRNLDKTTLYGHYLAADVALVTPLRDGMNLVAMEYVAARTDLDGMLVLSELAGAAEHLTDAVQVNPYDVGAITDALERVAAMSAEEGAERMASMRRMVERLDVHRWAASFLEELDRPVSNARDRSAARPR